MRAFTLALTVLAAAAAQASAAPLPRKGEAGYDPDRLICKSKPAIGSRLKRIRECATAAQWEEMERAERIGLSAKQFNGDPGCPEPPCVMVRAGKDTPW